MGTRASTFAKATADRKAPRYGVVLFWVAWACGWGGDGLRFGGMQKVIVDSDWGGDVMQLASVLVSRPSEYKVLGATVTFGNASLRQNLQNAGAMLRFLGVDGVVPRYAGAVAPSEVEEQPEGDEAHGRTGLGDAVMELSEVAPAEMRAVDFLIDAIGREPAGSVVLVATGPQTNVAEAIRRAPEVMGRLKEIRIMGGCVRELSGYRVNERLERLGTESILRKGNITERAEFNFQQAPGDARVVLESGIRVALFPMDCTHQLTFTKEREGRLAEVFGGDVERLKVLGDLLSAPRLIDERKWGIAPVMHDVHTTVSMVAPELYAGRRGQVKVSNEGETDFLADEAGPHWVAERVVDADAVFEELMASLGRLLLSRG
ncbi:Inosine-uridine preferring nucleoside hydrolase superfamily [Verrucomicrobiia bacterium DG1235]|nr:Inosine-uridine preferring nucleoside hydrolase superfamily [Verrucomicrobiae bacterium DG1235]